MKTPKLSDVKIDWAETKKIRSMMAKAEKIKITINIDRDSLHKLRNLAANSGASYQKLLNQILREGLNGRKDLASRVDRIERELERLKKRRVA
jgi:uncharacterized protein (DUF4415 family)